jgi:hypothetical protein
MSENYQYAPMLENGLMVNGGQVVSTPAHEVTRDKGDGVHQWNSDGTFQEKGIVKQTHNPDEFREQAIARGSIMGTAKPQGKSSNPIDHKATVLIPNGNGGTMECSIAVAERLGLVTRAPGGGWVDANAAAPQAAPQASVLGNQGQPAAAPAAPAAQHLPLPLLPATVEQIEALEQNLPGPVYAGIVSRLIAGQDINQTNTALDTSTLAAVKGVAGEIAMSLQAQASHWLGKQGVDGGDFREWAESNHPQEFQQACRMQYETRSPLHFGPLVSKYMKGTVPSTAALTQAGFNPRVINGEEVVTIGGYTMPTKVARRAGLIS